jgi:uncharacterized cupin superfamily protein
MNRVRIDDLPWEEIHSPARKFHSYFKNLSIALGGARNVGPWGGGHPFDLQLRRVPPGAAICPFHSHLAQWELYVIRTGAGTARAGDGPHPVTAGDVFVHPPGEPHQLTNSGAADLEVFIVADNPQLDACYYPDSNKWALRPPGKIFRLTEVDYLDGEETPVAGGATYRPAPSPAPTPPLPPFMQRKLNVDRLPWEGWQSPKGKFHGGSKELSIALGAKRNTPTGLGGHPFDLELGKLGPGECGCPFHSHASQWELFVFLSGEGTIRAGDGTHPVRAGDVVLHPPREAHQFTNTGATDLLYYLIADNPPVDYWHYPDSGKWGLREPRMFFRPAEADYWDGEE